jgi:hypothetical protein
MKSLVLGLVLAALLAAPSSSEAQLFRRRPRAAVAPARRVVVARPRIVARAPVRRVFAIRPRAGVARGVFRGRVR